MSIWIENRANLHTIIIKVLKYMINRVQLQEEKDKEMISNTDNRKNVSRDLGISREV